MLSEALKSNGALLRLNLAGSERNSTLNYGFLSSRKRIVGNKIIRKLYSG